MLGLIDAKIRVSDKDLPVLYRSTKSLDQIHGELKVTCHCCREKFEPASILRHIGKVKTCKLFYGSNFEELRRKKELARKKDRYENDPNVKKRKQESYQEQKKYEKIEKEKEKYEFRKIGILQGVEYERKIARKKNSKGKKRLQWVKKCFQHYFEKFIQIDDPTKEKMGKLEKIIGEEYLNLGAKFEEVLNTAKNVVNSATFEGGPIGPYTLYIKTRLGRFSCEDFVQRQWEELERKIAKDLKNILNEVEDADKNTDWYFVLEKICETFQLKYKGWWIPSSGLYEEQILEEPCIICNHEPNCLEKNGKTIVYEKI